MSKDPKDVEIEELLRQSASVRTILSGTDIGSLPHDWTLEQIAEARWKDLAETREKNVELHAWADSMLRKIEVLEAQIAKSEGNAALAAPAWNPEVMAALGASKFTEGEYQQTDGALTTPARETE